MAEAPLRTNTIPGVKLSRIEADVSWATSGYSANGGADVVAHFGYDHGNMLITDKNGKTDLLFEHNGDSLRSNACRVLWNMNPAVIRELIRGYRLARAAGLLGDGRINPAVASLLSYTGSGVSTADERIKAGYEQSKLIRDELRKEDRKPGGIPVIDGEALLPHKRSAR